MHYVEMLNGNDTGAMVFEPDFLQVHPGDTVKFLATNRPHNAATIEDFIPEAAEPFTGNINEEIEVTFTVEGFYGIKCSPHYDMGMVMLIQVGEGELDDALVPAGLPEDAEARFYDIIARAHPATAQ
jgi:pseudoazurin